MYIRKKNDTDYKVKADAALLDFLMQQTGATRTSVKQLLANRRVQVNGACHTRHDTPLRPGDTVTVCNSKANIRLGFKLLNKSLPFIGLFSQYNRLQPEFLQCTSHLLSQCLIMSMYHENITSPIIYII